MALSKRKFLALIGGGTVLAAGGFLNTRTATAALTPWELAGTYPDIRRRALSYALLAPNPHNRQPWIAELTGEDGITLYRDKSRNLPATDPFDRQLTIGMGCFIELLAQSTAQDGVVTSFDLFPDGEDGAIAHVKFDGTADPDPLFAHIMNRRTNRNPYELERKITAQQAETLVQSAHSARIDSALSEDRIVPLRKLTLAATMLEANTEATHAETANLMRFGKSQIEANPDGIALGGPLLDTLHLIGAMNREQMLDPSSSAFSQMISMFENSIASTPAFIWLNTTGNTRKDQIAAGRDWVRLHLAATGLGLSMQPMSQSLQEYPEMAQLHTQAHDMLAKPGETVQMLARLGYGPKQKPAPRWPLETRLKHG